MASCEIKVGSTGRSSKVLVVPGFLSRREQLLSAFRYRFAFFLHARDGGFDAGRVPQFEWPHLPVEAQLHRPIDLHGGVGDFRNAVGSVSPQLAECTPQECTRLVALLWPAAFQ